MTEHSMDDTRPLHGATATAEVADTSLPLAEPAPEAPAAPTGPALTTVMVGLVGTVTAILILLGEGTDALRNLHPDWGTVGVGALSLIGLVLIIGGLLGLRRQRR